MDSRITYITSPEKPKDFKCAGIVPLCTIGNYRFAFLETGLCWMFPVPEDAAVPEFQNALRAAATLYYQHRQLCAANRTHTNLFHGLEDVNIMVKVLHKKKLPIENIRRDYEEWLWMLDSEPFGSMVHARLVIKAFGRYIFPNPGYIYLVASPTGHYKIGKAKNVQNRLRTFGVKLPFEVELLHTIFSGDYTAAERELHRRYAARRVNGSEFFALSADEVEQIKAIEEM